MTFYIREYTSEEKFDISKFMKCSDNIYDVLSSPFLDQLHQLSTVSYYNVNDGYSDIDMIATDAYNDPFYAYLIQYYNSDFRDSFPEGTVLNLFSLDDLNNLFTSLYNNQSLSNEDE